MNVADLYLRPTRFFRLYVLVSTARGRWPDWRDLARLRRFEGIHHERGTMRRYLIASGALFGLLALVHLARLAMEGTGPLGNPFFIAITVIAAALATWAVLLLRHPAGPNRVVRAYPMLPRHEAEIRRLAHDLTVPRASDKDDFYRRMGVARETWHLQETSLGHWVIVVTDMAGKQVEQVARDYAKSPRDFDRWFKEQVMLITGIDPSITPLGPPTEELFDSGARRLE